MDVMIVIAFFLFYKKTFEVKNNVVVNNNMCMGTMCII